MKIELPGRLESRATRLLRVACGVFALVMGGFGILWYLGRIDWFNYIDIPLHLIGGLVSSLCFLLFLVMVHGDDGLRRIPRSLRCVLVLGFTALVTIAWEFFEYFTDTYLGTQLQSTVIETLKDMAVGLAGAVPVATWLTSDASLAGPDSQF